MSRAAVRKVFQEVIFIDCMHVARHSRAISKPIRAFDCSANQLNRALYGTVQHRLHIRNDCGDHYIHWIMDDSPLSLRPG